jgi:hypothetical protein
MRLALFYAFLTLAGLLSASEDPLLARFSAPLAPGSWGVEAGVQEFSRETWFDRHGQALSFGGSYLIPDADGVSKSVKGFRFDLDILWAASQRNLLELSIPYYNQEFSAYNPANTLPSSLGDPTVRRADASGDLALAYRRLLLGRAGAPLRAGASLGLSAPTGQGPFESQHPLVATGDGGFVGSLALDLQARAGDWMLWLQADAPYEFGYSADIAPGTFVGFAPDESPETLPGGRAWVSRDFSYEGLLGLGWNWYSSGLAHHRLALEAQFKRQGPMLIDGKPILDSDSIGVNLVPEARFAFDGGPGLNLGWILPMLETNQPVGYWGEILIRVDFER